MKIDDELLQVAILGKSVGLKGYLKLHNKSDFVQQFKNGAIFFDKDGKEFTVKAYDKANQSILFYGYEDVDLAKTLTNKILFTTKDITRKTCKLKNGEYFYFDILGLCIVENNEILGVVKDIDDNTNTYLLEISTDTNLIKQNLPKSFYIPYIDNFVISINLKDKTIYTKNSKAILENS